MVNAVHGLPKSPFPRSGTVPIRTAYWSPKPPRRSSPIPVLCLARRLVTHSTGHNAYCLVLPRLRHKNAVTRIQGHTGRPARAENRGPQAELSPWLLFTYQTELVTLFRPISGSLFSAGTGAFFETCNRRHRKVCIQNYAKSLFLNMSLFYIALPTH